MKLLPVVLMFSSVLGAATITTLPPKPLPAPTKVTLTPLQQVEKYADGRKMTITKRGGGLLHHTPVRYWVEIANVDAHGVGETKAAAIQDFLYRVDLLEHEVNKPYLKNTPQDPGPPPGFVCPQGQECM